MALDVPDDELDAVINPPAGPRTPGATPTPLAVLIEAPEMAEEDGAALAAEVRRLLAAEVKPITLTGLLQLPDSGQEGTGRDEVALDGLGLSAVDTARLEDQIRELLGRRRHQGG